MSLPETLRFEDLGRPGERVVGGAICFFEVVGKRAPKRGEWFASGAIPMAYKAKTEPDRCYGVRVAYDRSMALGEMMVGEVHAG